MQKISDKIINFIKNTMKNWKVKLTGRGQTLAEVKIQRSIFQGSSLSPLQFVITMMLLNCVFRECTWGYKFTKSYEKIDHLIYMKGINVFAKNEKELEMLIKIKRIYFKDTGMEFGIEKMCLANNIKRENEKQREKSGKHENTCREGKLQILWNIGSGQHQTREVERKSDEWTKR